MWLLAPAPFSIIDDEYLSRYFWQEPADKRASQSKKTMYDARTWLPQKERGVLDTLYWHDAGGLRYAWKGARKARWSKLLW